MDYFVSAESVPGQEWQLELLLESFKKMGMESSLTIMLSKNGYDHYRITKGIFSHPKTMYHQSLGAGRGHRRLDDLYTLNWCMINRIISSPFCVISPHVVLRSSLENFIITENRSIVFAPDPFFTLERAQEALGDFWTIFNKEKSFFENRWAHIGSVLIVNEFGDWFTRALVSVAERLVLEQVKQGKEVWEETVRVAWCICIAEAVADGHGRAYGDYQIAATMNDNRQLPVIDYEHGLPPVFNRKMFAYAGAKKISFGDPIDVLSERIETKNAHYMSDLAKSINERQAPAK